MSNQQPPKKKAKAIEEHMDDLLDLAEAGEQVHWSDALAEAAARKRKHERQGAAEPITIRLRREKPERVSNTESTLGVASVRVQPSLAAAPARQPAPHIVWALGPGHDLRLSGEVIWCRKCGRYGEERIKKAWV